MSGTAELFRSEEMADLMDRLEQLLEATVVCVVLCHPSGAVSVTCPPQKWTEVLDLMQRIDWARFR